MSELPDAAIVPISSGPGRCGRGPFTDAPLPDRRRIPSGRNRTRRWRARGRHWAMVIAGIHPIRSRPTGWRWAKTMGRGPNRGRRWRLVNFMMREHAGPAAGDVRGELRPNGGGEGRLTTRPTSLRDHNNIPPADGVPRLGGGR